jgi:hypothetical protein
MVGKSPPYVIPAFERQGALKTPLDGVLIQPQQREREREREREQPPPPF